MIRRLKTLEYQQALEIAESYRGPGFRWTPKLLTSELTEHEVFGHFQGHQLMAFLVVANRGSVSEFTVLATRKGARGWMRLLMDEVITKWVQSDEIWLEVHESNLRAIQLYESLQFQRVGCRPRYYSDGATAIQMTLKRTASNI